MNLTQEQKFKFRLRLEREQAMAEQEPQRTFSDVMSQIREPQRFSPQSLLEQVPSLLSNAAHKVGTYVSENLARPELRKLPFSEKVYDAGSMNPNVAAAIGTAISISPDIAMAGINPMAGAKTKIIPDMAISAQRRALGFRIPELKTEFGRGQAARAAKVSLKEGITSALGSPKEIFGKVTALKAKSGQALGQIRESVGSQPVKTILNAIDDYKVVRLKGATGGKWDTVANKIEEAKETIAGVVPEGSSKVSLKRIAEAKKEISDSVNWLSDNVSQKDAKGLAMAIEKGTEKALAEAGGDIKAYKALKPIYSAAKTMIKGLNREVAAQEGNMAVSLPALVAGASGGSLTALKIGAFELAKRRGAGIAASEIMGAANAPIKYGIPAISIGSVLSRRKKK